MWEEIKTTNDPVQFMNQTDCFHDSCIKEIHYISGAYVRADPSMHSVNDKRLLRVIIQRKLEGVPMIELEFSGLRWMKLNPVDDEYTCEVLDSTMAMKNDYIYWCACGNLSELDLDTYNGTVICASSLRWRSIQGHMGEDRFYQPAIP